MQKIDGQRQGQAPACEGRNKIRFDVSGMTEDEKGKFEPFLDDWKEEYDPNETRMAWLFELEQSSDSNCYDEADDYGHSDTAADTRRLLKEAAKKFPALKAEGCGAWRFVGTGGGSKHSFALENGKLDWREQDIEA